MNTETALLAACLMNYYQYRQALQRAVDQRLQGRAA